MDEALARRPAQPCRPGESGAGSKYENHQGAFERKAFPGVDRLTQRIDRPAGLHHDLDKFLKDAEHNDEGEADGHRLAKAFGRPGQRGA